jgi:uncharacterized protein (DUF2249 family)
MNRNSLDLRGVPALQRHALMAASFQRLPAGGALELIADADPQPLQTQLQLERKGQFSWELVEQDGQTWRVRIAKAGAQDCCGGCTCN